MADLHSKIILVGGINIDRNYVNVLSYTENQMLALCQANAIAQANDYQFIRTTNSIYTNFTYSQCLQANYIAFQNPDYSNKWFFAFIDDVIYQGEENTEITFTVDAWSTWYGNWTKKPCYVIRQHATNDSIGSNTIDENLDIGDIVEEEYVEYSGLSSIYYAIVSTWNPSANGQLYYASKYNKNLWGGSVFLFTSEVDVRQFIAKTNNQGHIADIQNLFIIPQDIFVPSDIQTWNDSYNNTNYTFYTISQSASSTTINSSRIIKYDLSTFMSSFYNFSDITVKNNKCKVYPYNYLFVSNNIGNNNIYKFENFSNGVKFNIELALSVGGSVRAVPLNYKKETVNYDESLPLAKFPTCSWSADSFTNWLTQQGVNVITSVATGVVSGATQMALGSVGTGIATVGGTVANLIGNLHQASLLPSISGGNNTGDVNFSSGKNTFYFRRLRVKTEYMRIIDDYFTRFGYKTIRVVSPNLTGRTYWNYIEIGPHEEIGYGDVPTKYMEEINKACRTGVTIWHNHSNIGNYTLNNTIVS